MNNEQHWKAVHQALKVSRHGDSFTGPDGYRIDNFHGFKRYREPGGLWRFNVTGFDGTSGGNGWCTVETVTGRQSVRIDAKDRIEINGKRHTSLHWTH